MVPEAAVQARPVSCRLGLGAQEGPKHGDCAEEELAAAQAAARVIAGEDGLGGLVKGLIWGIWRQGGQW